MSVGHAAFKAPASLRYVTMPPTLLLEIIGGAGSQTQIASVTPEGLRDPVQDGRPGIGRDLRRDAAAGRVCRPLTFTNGVDCWVLRDSVGADFWFFCDRKIRTMPAAFAGE
jgi:hypothetical protein